MVAKCLAYMRAGYSDSSGFTNDFWKFAMFRIASGPGSLEHRKPRDAREVPIMKSIFAKSPKNLFYIFVEL